MSVHMTMWGKSCKLGLRLSMRSKWQGRRSGKTEYIENFAPYGHCTPCQLNLVLVML